MRYLPLALLVACTGTDDTPTDDTPDTTLAVGEAFCPAGIDTVEPRVAEIVAALSPEDKLKQLSGLGADSTGVYPTTPLPTWDLPGLRMVDGPRGVSRNVGNATAFPVGALRGATWDPQLEGRVGEAMGIEAAAYTANVLLAPTMNILRHPRWGRAQETYGEDPLHMGRMAVGFVQGVQSTGVAASAKHYAANSIEDTRFEVDVQLDERTLREIYLPHFRDVVEAGVATVMSAYNRVNGTYCAENDLLLRDILKGDWAFPGLVESDWVFGTRSTLPSLEAGLDIEMPTANFYGEPLREAWQSGLVDEALLDEAVSRIVRVQLCLGMDREEAPAEGVVESPSHLALARQVAAQGMVLLENDGTLPLAGTETVALLGPLVEEDNIGDRGSSSVDPTDVVTVREGLEAAFDTVVTLQGTPDADDLDGADVAVVVVGLTDDDEGESLIAAGDRERYALPADDIALVQAVTALHDHVVVVLVGGAALGVEEIRDDLEALIMAWYPGSEGGHALADLLTGAVDARGRLPHAWAVSDADLPLFDNTSASVQYDRWHGYRHLDREGIAARYPFGFGRSYTTWSFDSLAVEGDTAVATVRNTGSRPGHQIVQLYASPPDDDDDDRAAKVLVGWAHTGELAPGATITVEIPVDRDPTRAWLDGWVEPMGSWTLLAGAHADDLPLSAAWTP